MQSSSLESAVMMDYNHSTGMIPTTNYYFVLVAMVNRLFSICRNVGQSPIVIFLKPTNNIK